MGRFRKRDGCVASHIFRYRSRRPHREVMEGLKLELVQEPNRLRLVQRASPFQPKAVTVLSPFESVMGKWKALSTSLAGRRHTGGECVRHPTDLAAMGGSGAFDPGALSIDRSVSGDWQQIRTHRAAPANLAAFNAALIASDAVTARPSQSP